MKLPARAGILLMILGLAGIAVWRAAALTTWSWILTHHEAVRNLSLVVAGVIAVRLAYWRAGVAEYQAETARRSLLNERDQKAAEMLGSDLLSVRLGGIYALQTLAAEHPPHYHLGVIRQFCAFIREPRNSTLTDASLASLPGGTAPGPIPTASDARLGAAAGDAAPAEPVREDVRAVMDAIAARSDVGIAVEQKEKGFRLDLSGANLREWRFPGANLSGVNLSGANLVGAKLSKANLSGVNLSGVDLSGADLSKANLSGANLPDVNLSGVDLSGVDLSGVDLSGAKLSKATLFEANLSEANLFGANLSGDNLFGANLSEANLSKANLSKANLSKANLSKARFSAGTVITQEQLNETLAVPPEKPPIFVGDVRDAKTKALLNWRPR